MITVWSVCVGDKYPIGYVYALRDMVDKYLTIPHTFRCISDKDIPGVFCIYPKLDHKSWWAKLNVFNEANTPSVFFDLDIIITDNIDFLENYTDTFSAVPNWAQSGHGGIQSSVMAWPGNWSFPYDELIKTWDSRIDRSDGYTGLNGKTYWGDQEYLWDLLGNNWRQIPNVGSYKYHVRPPLGKGEIPDWMKICVFHGEPKPTDVKDPCLLSYTQTLRNHTSKPMQSTSDKGLSGTG